MTQEEHQIYRLIIDRQQTKIKWLAFFVIVLAIIASPQIDKMIINFGHWVSVLWN